MSWQHYLYSQLGSKKSAVISSTDANGKSQLEETVDRIVAMSKVLFGLHMVRITVYPSLFLFLKRKDIFIFLHFLLLIIFDVLIYPPL